MSRDLSILHVIIRATETNSQYNEHCLPVMDERWITVCSLYPADVVAPPSLRLVEGDGTTWGCFRALRRALALDRYDAVHVHAPASGVLTLMTHLMTFRSRRNLVFTVHNSWRNFRFRNRMFLYLVLALFPTVVACGRAARDSFPRSLRTLFGGRISVVQNGVDLARVDRCLGQVNGTPRPDGQGRTVVSVGRLIPIKDPRSVLDAFARSAGADDRLVFVGEGPLRTQLVDAVEEMGLTERVRFTGLVERDEVYRLLSRADVFVSASRGEGLPVSVLEAMACKCPVVLSDIPPHREIARMARVARDVPLVPCGDTPSLSAALAAVLDMNPRSRRRLGARLRLCVKEHFSVQSMNDAYGAIYQDMVTKHHPAPSQGPSRAALPDSEVTLPRRMARHWPLVVGLSLLGGVAGFAYAAVQAPQYEAKASVVVGEPFGGLPTDDSVKTSQALAATFSDLARREPVLEPVARQLQLGDWRLLQNKVHSQPGDKNPMLIQLIATADSSTQAEELAEAVAGQLVTLTTNTDKSPDATFAEREMNRLSVAMEKSESRIDALTERLDKETDPDLAANFQADLQDVRNNLTAMQTNYQGYLDTFVTSGFAGQVEIVEHAYAVPTPVRPDPVTLTAAGLAAGFLLAVALLHMGAGGRRSASPPEPVSYRLHNGQVAHLPVDVGGEVRVPTLPVDTGGEFELPTTTLSRTQQARAQQGGRR
ncbi:MAG TPA: glycosyltransferase [Nocardioides sp.]|nr:glycosyltransferase [Nocardioides sp.]